MKAKILVGAVAALLYSGAALAGGNKDCPPSNTQASNMDSQAVQDDSLSVIETEPVDPAIGGSGQAGIEGQDLEASDPSLLQDDGVVEDPAFGGSGQAGMNKPSSAQGEVLLRCQPMNQGTGGSGSSWDSGSSTGGSGFQSEPLREPETTPAAPVSPPSSAFTPIETDEDDADVNRESDADMRGLTVMVGGGVEGYTGELAPAINPGAAYGVTASIKPSKVMGLELGYNGAVNNLDNTALGADSGPDLVRNGGQAAVTLGLGAAPIQPYVLGGIGFSDYNFRGAAASGFSDDVVGNVPVGAGLRTHIGDFTADLRANYNFLFDQDFAGVDDGLNENGRYSGTLNIGGTF